MYLFVINVLVNRWWANVGCVECPPPSLSRGDDGSIYLQENSVLVLLVRIGATPFSPWSVGVVINGDDGVVLGSRSSSPIPPTSIITTTNSASRTHHQYIRNINASLCGAEALVATANSKILQVSNHGGKFRAYHGDEKGAVYMYIQAVHATLSYHERAD